MARAESPTVDETFELLSHSRARLVLQYFDQHPNPVKLEDITEMVARWEAPEGTSPTPKDRELVRENLHEECLPWMATLDIVAYDPDGRMARYDGGAISTAMANVKMVLGFLWSANGDAETGLGDEHNLTGDNDE